MSGSESKQQVRERIWHILDSKQAVATEAFGRIPNFHGAGAASNNLATLPQWRAATVVKANPDKPQAPVRELALATGKTLFMAVPKLAEAKPFYYLNPLLEEHPPREAATPVTASEYAPTVEVDQMKPMGHIDFIITGSVAVNPNGVRIGKGAGYADLEVAILTDAGLVDDRTVLATTVHDLQVLNEDLPEEQHDFRLDLIITPSKIIECPKSSRPYGLDWSRIPLEKIEAIPALAARRPS
ncbi:5-formyltetrahydrofolate cyclo-ligase [Glycomyces sp. NPDC046736]|uniref:5-formyltetrahydrofolate cyclo-ligase n=1 Tax=Glycomyces sp. NPDC046736 TaxID=3155615 RepID=UPI0033C33A27